MEPGKPVPLRCSVQHYDWGRVGHDSTVARLFARNSGAEIDPARPYAELWVGTHPSGPSFVLCEPDPVPLKSWLMNNPHVVGEKVAERWGTDLPFLLKVLSVAKALSIQAHPDKELAEVLHRTQPGLYKDSNHKPEMAVALTEFKALCGFVSLEELKDVLNRVPEIRELVGEEDASKVVNIKDHDGCEKDKTILQSIFTKLMSASKEAVSGMIFKLKTRLNMESKVRTLTEKEELVLHLEQQYPADVGVISAFFFNYVKLKPGEALYLGANELHAYISGECIECMATSDNVVRAGLTPKYRDVQTLCSMLTYKQGFPEILQGNSLNPHVLRYTPPFDEFEVDRCLIPSGESVVLPAVPGPSIFIIIAGEGSMQVGSAIGEDQVAEGHALLVPAQCDIRIKAGAARELMLYRAGVNTRCFR